MSYGVKSHIMMCLVSVHAGVRKNFRENGEVK
jgi:hypothetical protein